MKKLRLAIVATHPVQYQVPLYRRLAAHPRMDLTVFYGSDYGVAVHRDPGFGIPVRWDRPMLDGYRWKVLGNFSPLPSIDSRRSLGIVNPRIVPEILGGTFDAILIPGTWSVTYWLSMLAARLRGIPVLFRGEVFLAKRPAGVRGSIREGLRRAWFRAMSACLAIGSASEEYYRHYDVDPERIFRAPYAVDNDFFGGEAARWKGRKEEAKRRIGADPAKPVLLFSGKLVPGKRPHDCLRAAARIKTPCSVVYIGEGPLRHDLEREARDLGIPAVFAGFRNQSELPGCYAAGDVFALPSEQESFGLVINEAMCSGLPILVSTGVASARDLVRDGMNGFLFAPGDLPGMASGLEQLLSDPEKRRRMGEESAARISGWNTEVAVEGILRAVDHVSGKGTE